MEKPLVQYTPSELIKILEEGFSQIYKPFAKYQKQQTELWKKCIEIISDFDTLNKLIFCNDVVKIPPVKIFICIHSELKKKNDLTACDKKFVGCFFSFLFTSIFCYREKKNITIRNQCIKTATLFSDKSDPVVIIPELVAKSESLENKTGKTNKIKAEVKNDSNKDSK